MFQSFLVGDFGIVPLFLCRDFELLLLWTLVQKVGVLSHELHQVCLVHEIGVQGGIVTWI